MINSHNKKKEIFLKRDRLKLSSSEISRTAKSYICRSLPDIDRCLNVCISVPYANEFDSYDILTEYDWSGIFRI